MGECDSIEGKGLEAFQAFLDDHFPRGAMCITFGAGGRFSDASDPLATGRLICADSTQDDRGRWWYQLIIDPRRSPDENVDTVILWVDRPRQHLNAPDLWESDVRSSPAAPRILRLNANPPGAVAFDKAHVPYGLANTGGVD